MIWTSCPRAAQSSAHFRRVFGTADQIGRKINALNEDFHENSEREDISYVASSG